MPQKLVIEARQVGQPLAGGWGRPLVGIWWVRVCCQTMQPSVEVWWFGRKAEQVRVWAPEMEARQVGQPSVGVWWEPQRVRFWEAVWWVVRREVVWWEAHLSQADWVRLWEVVWWEAHLIQAEWVRLWEAIWWEVRPEAVWWEVRLIQATWVRLWEAV